MFMIIIYIIIVVVIGLLISFAKVLGCLIAAGGAQLLFNPRANSVVLMIVWIILISTGNFKWLSPISFILIFLIWVDCIRDIKLGHEFYDYRIGVDIDLIHIEKFLVIKSLLSLFTLGYARIIYLLFVYSSISSSVKNQIKEKIKSDKPIHADSFILHSQPRRYYYEKDIYELLSKDRIIGVSDVIAEELDRHYSKYQNNLPKSWIEKVKRKFKPNEKDARKARIENKMYEARNMYEIYMSRTAMDKLAQTAISVLQNGAMSPGDIATFPGFKEFEFGTSINGTRAWGEFFIIKSLKPYVEQGKVIDNGEFIDDADNHMYAVKGAGPKVIDMGDIE